MTTLFTTEDKKYGLYSKLEFDVITDKENLFVEFLQTEYTDCNKWNKPKVLSDIVYKTFQLANVVTHFDPTGKKLKEYILNCAKYNNALIDEIARVSKEHKKVIISLPTSYFSFDKTGLPTSNRRFKDSIYPLIVNVNGKDVSREFIDFGDYGEHSVEVAYNALVKGKNPEKRNDIFYVSGVTNLHEQLFENQSIK